MAFVVGVALTTWHRNPAHPAGLTCARVRPARVRPAVCLAVAGRSRTEAALPDDARPLILQQIERPVANVERLGTVFVRAQAENRFLSNNELETLGSDDVARELRDASDLLVAKARSKLLDRFPGIAQPGGALYPEFRSEACWRDFAHFQRIVHYAVAAEKPKFTSHEGLAIMRELYMLLDVPVDAMVFGLEALAEVAEEHCKTRRIHWSYDAQRSYKHLMTSVRKTLIR